jgi:ribosomal protein L37AE/L43A
MIDNWRQEYEDATAELNLLLIEQARLRNALTKAQAEVESLRATKESWEQCEDCNTPMQYLGYENGGWYCPVCELRDQLAKARTEAEGLKATLAERQKEDT